MAETILDGGSATVQNQYTGVLNELTVDESNRDLRLHDEATPGGHVILSAARAAALFQPKSSDLDGLSGFEPQERGFWVRLGPGDFTLRTITVTAGQLTITDANGYAGNPVIGLDATITSEHTWTGQQIFEDVVQFNAGINADVAGNVTGNLTGNTTGAHVGAVDVRGAVLQLDDDQIPMSKISGLDAAIAAAVSGGIPAGIIAKWSSSLGTIPAGWLLCDGTAGTLDLRNCFIVGAGDAYAVGATGGSASLAPTVTVDSGGAHTHSLSGNTASAASGVTVTGTSDALSTWDRTGNVGNPLVSVSRTDPGHVHANSGTADSNGAHTHTAAVASFDNRPPFYALCYIQKG